ncbi:MAG TPA: hypothetical protein VE135_14680 [Pyrinomonadaceae bacterium]|nr:hypothetical protein [Pyrinomonadaceae bacterium]
MKSLTIKGDAPAKILVWIAIVLFVAMTPAVFPANISAPQTKEEYTGTVIGIGGQLGGTARPFTLTIEGHSSEADVGRALAVLAEGGQDAFLKELRGKKLGYFSMGSQLGRDLNFVQEIPTADGGRRIVVLFERWMNIFELRYGTRSEDYPFTYIELMLDRTGKGRGTLIPAARIYFDKKHGNEIDVENFGIYPAQLSGVELRNKN